MYELYFVKNLLWRDVGKCQVRPIQEITNVRLKKQMCRKEAVWFVGQWLITLEYMGLLIDAPDFLEYNSYNNYISCNGYNCYEYLCKYV